ncbi:MAG: DUF98 domain-containing protein [Methanobacteriota archaeon]|nr:MAG: DUF98 domain-containing protein [Euryarchaeota archaeon]
MKTLGELERETALHPVHKLLLANTGSMTALLEALFGEIGVEAESQGVVVADEKTARMLRVGAGAKVNRRLVRLTGGGRVLVHATSYAPLSRLKGGFRADMMGLDVPIGRILAKHRLESRREILGFDLLGADKGFSGVFGVPAGSTLLIRRYNIIHGDRPLMNITEVFPYEIAEWAAEG